VPGRLAEKAREHFPEDANVSWTVAIVFHLAECQSEGA
jgi:hypothetical protein